jgi:diguanylate cyclase (GGDEF)-like protein
VAVEVLGRRAWALRAAFALVAAAVVARAAYSLGSGGAAGESLATLWLYTGAMVGSSLLCLLRGVLVRAERAAWLLMGLGAACWTAGDLVWDLVWTPAGIEPPAPNAADALYLSYYVLSCVALVLLLHERLRHLRPSLVLDGLVAGLTLAALSAALVLGAVTGSAQGGNAAVAVALAYPLADEVLLCFVGVTFAVTGWRPGVSWALLSLGLVATSVADSAYAYLIAAGTWQDTMLVSALWPLSLLATGAAAWLPARREPVRATGSRLVAIPSLFALVAVALLFYGQLGRLPVAAGALAGLALLVGLWRARLVFAENAELLRRFRAEALTDALTGLGNRRRLIADLEGRLSGDAAARGSLLLFDLDGFKLYNDTFGHAAGDALLERLAANLAFAVADEGSAYRLGGDEFCVLLEHEVPPDEPVVARSCAALCEHSGDLAVTASLGLVRLPAEALTPSAALQLADERMYEHKATHANSRRGRLVEELRAAAPAAAAATSLPRSGTHAG